MTWHELLAGDPWVVAPHLLGAHLRSSIDGAVVQVRITEVEAYAGVGIDPGSHAFHGMTKRNSAMFGPPGCSYIYFTYGMHWCLNIVASPQGSAGAVLLRAGEIIQGHDEALQRAGRPMRHVDLAKGPARLARALGIRASNAASLNGGSFNGGSVIDDGPLQLLGSAPQQVPAQEIGPRTGVSGAGATTAWRFWLPNEPTVSPYKAAKVRTEHLRP